LSGVVASLYANFYANTGPLQNGLNAASLMLKKFTGGVGGAAMALTGSNAAMQLMERGFNATIGTVKKVLASTAEYSDQIRQLTRDTGMSVEQSAKMLMIADDSQVSFSSLTTAMKFAIRDGVLPNIAGIAKLSDEYLALNNPLERSQMLIKQFGRNGLEMSKIMELGSSSINKLGETTEQVGLLMSSVDIAKMRAYEQAMNEMKDAGQGLGVQLALWLAPGLTDIANSFADTVKGGRESTLQIDSARKAYAEMGLNVAEADHVMAKHVVGIYNTTQMSGAWLDAVGRENYELDKQGNIVNKLTTMWAEYGRVRTDEVIKRNIKVESNVESNATDLSPNLIKDTLGGINDLQTQVKLDQLGGQELTALNAQIAELAKTSPEAANQLNNELLPAVMKMAVDSKQMTFKEAVAGMVEMGWNSKDATKAIQGAGSMLRAVNGITAHLYIYTHYISVFGGIQAGASGRGGSVIGGQQDRAIGEIVPKTAKGANFIVPPGYPNDSYPMLVESGEKVIVIPRNKVNQIPKFDAGTKGPGGYGGSYSGSPFWGLPSSLLGQAKPYQASFSGPISNKGGKESMYGPSEGPMNDPLFSKKLFTELGLYTSNEQTSIKTSITKSVNESINTTIAGLVTAQTAKTAQQISTISGRQQETAQKNTMISGDMLAELTAIRKGIENIPIAVRDAVTLVAD
jgi:hypothetical protein